jgi:penicillin-binding protein 1A
VAGKTGTTTSNKDGWFIGFSSGLTTGVWMGRDDARPIRGLQGGTAPARAFHDFMSVAVARRPIEGVETQVPMPDWQLTPEEEMYGDSSVDQNGMAPLVDANGNPLPMPLPQQPGAPPPMVRPDGTGEPTQQELDQAFPPRTPMPQPQPRQPAPQPPPPEQGSPSDSPQPRGIAS